MLSVFLWNGERVFDAFNDSLYNMDILSSVLARVNRGCKFRAIVKRFMHEILHDKTHMMSNRDTSRSVF